MPAIPNLFKLKVKGDLSSYTEGIEIEDFGIIIPGIDYSSSNIFLDLGDFQKGIEMIERVDSLGSGDLYDELITNRNIVRVDKSNNEIGFYDLEVPADIIPFGDFLDTSDFTKKLSLNLSGIATSTTRTLTMPNKDVNIGNLAEITGTPDANDIMVFNSSGVIQGAGYTLAELTKTQLSSLSFDKTDVGLGNVANSLQLVASNNLNDLPVPATARTNLGLGSLATLDNISSFSLSDLSDGSYAVINGTSGGEFSTLINNLTSVGGTTIANLFDTSNDSLDDVPDGTNYKRIQAGDITASRITKVGTISEGTWNGNVLGAAYVPNLQSLNGTLTASQVNETVRLMEFNCSRLLCAGVNTYFKIGEVFASSVVGKVMLRAGKVTGLSASCSSAGASAKDIVVYKNNVAQSMKVSLSSGTLNAYTLLNSFTFSAGDRIQIVSTAGGDNLANVIATVEFRYDTN